MTNYLDDVDKYLESIENECSNCSFSEQSHKSKLRFTCDKFVEVQ